MRRINPKRVLALLALTSLALVAFTARTALLDRELPQNSVQLGKLLFFDPLLSSNRTVSCASCHKPDRAFADNLPLSFGVDSNATLRNTPTVMYVSGRTHLFWDGRARSLEEQALGPLTNPKEQNISIDQAVKQVQQDAFYRKAFLQVFNAEPGAANLCQSLADFQKSLEPFTSPYDRFVKGDTDALSASAKRGMRFFMIESNCITCHSDPHFGGDQFFNVGLFNGKDKSDQGLFAITRDSTHLGRFKVPSLRNVAVTGPYMHDGSMKTLREVVAFYGNPDNFHNAVNLDDLLKTQRRMPEEEINDITEFLKSLTDEQFKNNIP